MASKVEQNLEGKGLSLPKVGKPVANYVPYTITGNLVFISGQLPLLEGTVKFQGKLGHDVSLEEGQQAAQLCGLNILAQLKEACEGDLDRVLRCLRLGGFVNAIESYQDHPKVINGASDLMVDAFGEIGKHARAAVGVSSLPLGASVEVEALFELKR
jgi:enamine deaminase RidA (YjgF/YER057c/UK114 family)